MKTLPIALFLLVGFSPIIQAQTTNDFTLKSKYSSENKEIRDILDFEGIDYSTLTFSGKELADKSFHLTVKEIWDGKITSDSTVMNSTSIPIEMFQKINDTVFSMTVISKHTDDDKLKMTFKFPRFSTTCEFNATSSEDYSLRNVAKAEGTALRYGQKFYLLAYILPYEKDGSKYWCAVESSGKEIETWGSEFGIKHYLVFEMIFQ